MEHLAFLAFFHLVIRRPIPCCFLLSCCLSSHCRRNDDDALTVIAQIWETLFATPGWVASDLLTGMILLKGEAYTAETDKHSGRHRQNVESAS